VSVHCPALPHFEPRKLLNFYFNADPDPAFHSNSDPGQLPETMRIRMCREKFQAAVESNAIAAPNLIIYKPNCFQQRMIFKIGASSLKSLENPA
jgi:hypothetical protein